MLNVKTPKALTNVLVILVTMAMEKPVKVQLVVTKFQCGHVQKYLNS
jgi:hypothetical protein